MTIDNVADLAPRIQYVAIAAQTDFDYTFPIFDEEDLVVDVDGVVQLLTTDYTVDGVGEDTGGTVTFTSAMAGGEVVTLYRETTVQRLTDFQQGGPYSSDSFNDELDRITLVLQELRSGLNRALRFPPTSEATSEDTLFSPITPWLGKFVYINDDGIPEPATSVDSELLTQSLIGQTLYPQTTAESSAGVTPTNYYHPPGYLYRYGTNATPGTTDMAAAFTSALLVSATHPTCIPQAVHLVGSALTVPTGGMVYGFGRKSVVKKGFNGDLFTMGAESELLHFYIDGDGSTRTGRGVVISTGGLNETSWRRLTFMSIIDMAGYCVEFTQATAGYASMLFGCRMTTTDQVVEAVKCPDTEASNGNRFMVGCWTFGTPLCHFGGCDNMVLNGCQGAYPTFTATTKKVNITGGRIVQNGPGSRTNWAIKGTAITITGIVSGVPTITFNNECFKVVFQGNAVASGTTFADTAGGVGDGNQIDIPHATYTPTWTGASGNPAIVSGFLGGTYRRDGDYCEVKIRMTAAADTTFGTGVWSFTLPYSAASKEVGPAYIFDSGTVHDRAVCLVAASAAVLQAAAGTGALVGAAAPHAWATSDELVMHIRYPIA